MPSHKTLKSVAFSIAHALDSPYHYDDGDFINGHILKSALSSGEEDLVIDILSGTASPLILVTPPVGKFLAKYSSHFPTLVQSNKSSMDFVEKATLTVHFDLEKKKPIANFGTEFFYEVPYSCTACIQDNRGKLYRYSLSEVLPQDSFPILMTRTEKLVNSFRRVRHRFINKARSLFFKMFE